jgi:hypothetical protein
LIRAAGASIASALRMGVGTVLVWLSVVRGVVVAIQGPDVVVDLGRERGLDGDSHIGLYRTIEIRHPQTGQKIRDELYLRSVDVAEIGKRLSVVRPPAEIVKELAIGDTVILDGAEEPASAPAAPVAACPDVGALLGRALAEGERRGRAAAESDAARAPALPPPVEQPPPIVAMHVAPAQLYRGQPAQLAFAVDAPLTAAWVYYRPAGASEYQRVPMAPAGAGYLRASLPPGALAAGGLEYFAEGSAGDRPPVALHASAARPAMVAITDPDPITSITKTDRSEIRLAYEYVDFNSLKGNDRYWIGEGSFLYRFGGYVHSLRMGAAAYSGVGGPHEGLDDGTVAPRPVGFNYGYTELELAVGYNVSTLIKVLAGLHDDGIGGGVEFKLRFGDERGTNLLVGGQVASKIGDLAMAKLTWDVIRELPMAGAIELTNEPVSDDLGVRMLFEIGWQRLRAFRPTVTVGYAVRTIHHGGPSVGLASVFTW